MRKKLDERRAGGGVMVTLVLNEQEASALDAAVRLCGRDRQAVLWAGFELLTAAVGVVVDLEQGSAGRNVTLVGLPGRGLE